MILVYTEGVLPGPDDFMRLHQAQNWLAGQGWYDLKAYRMAPPVGADMHWSRLIDLPIAALIGFFNSFLELAPASRMAAIIWPLVLFMLAVTAMISICDRLAGKEHRLLALLFFVLSINTLAEFKPGRLDHHNIQILLLILILLGVAKGLGKFSSYWVGLLISSSIMIGLDSLVLIVGILGFLALEWLFQKHGSCNRLLQTGIRISVSSTVLYIVSFPPERWFSNNSCDAFSLFYLSALLLLSSASIAMAVLSHKEIFQQNNAMIVRFVVGAALSVAIVLLMFSFFPHCLEGPYGNVSQELKSAWLDRISEAKGIIDRFAESPSYWSSQAIFLAIMICVTVLVLVKKTTTKGELAVLGFVVFISILGSFYQTRILRTGIYSVIPFCVILATMSWQWLEENLVRSKAVARLAQGLLCLILTSTFWVTIGLVASSLTSNEIISAPVASTKPTQVEEMSVCTIDRSFVDLQTRKASHIISDLNTAPALLLHTKHSVEAGSYHRNGNGILNVLAFFDGPINQVEKIADERAADFIVICREDIQQMKTGNKLNVATSIQTNQLPNWLEWVSKPNASLAVLKVVR